DAIPAHQSGGARVVADTATRPKVRAGRTLLGVDRLNRRSSLGSGTDRDLRAQPLDQAWLPLDPVRGRGGGGGGGGDPFLPAHARTPGCRGVKGALCRGERGVVAVHSQFAPTRADECSVHKTRVAQGCNTWPGVY